MPDRTDAALPVSPMTAGGAVVLPSAVAAPGERPRLKIYKGRSVDLVPLDAARHSEDLWRATRGEGDDALWTYLFDGPFASPDELQDNLARKQASQDPMFWAIIEASSGRALGHAALMRIEPVHRVIEVGNILFAPALQRTRGATEAMALMARIVFDELGYRRFEWKCNALNAPSRAAALRLGFSFEGIFRQHMIVKGRNRDTAWYSVLDNEWPAMAAGFAAWLDPSNFDEAGRQKRGLADCRRGAENVSRCGAEAMSRRGDGV